MRPSLRSRGELAALVSGCSVSARRHWNIGGAASRVPTLALMARKRREPAPVVIRRMDGDVVGVVPAEEFPRPKSLADYAAPTVRFEPIVPWELLDEQELLALKRGSPIAIGDDPEKLTWFVTDIDGPKRLINAATVVFDQPHHTTVSFDLVWPTNLAPEDEADAARAMQIIDQGLRRTS
jgi:hypothetical protein